MDDRLGGRQGRREQRFGTGTYPSVLDDRGEAVILNLAANQFTGYAEFAREVIGPFWFD